MNMRTCARAVHTRACTHTHAHTQVDLLGHLVDALRRLAAGEVGDSHQARGFGGRAALRGCCMAGCTGSVPCTALGQLDGPCVMLSWAATGWAT